MANSNYSNRDRARTDYDRDRDAAAYDSRTFGQSDFEFADYNADADRYSSTDVYDGSSANRDLENGRLSSMGRDDYRNDRGYGTPNYGRYRSGTDRPLSSRYPRDSQAVQNVYRSSRYSRPYGNDYENGRLANDYSRNRYTRPYTSSGNNYGYIGPERGWWDRASDEVASWFGDQEAEQRRYIDGYSDEQRQGRGPRGYKRSDERISEDINDRLSDQNFIDASDVEVSVSQGEVTLDGKVKYRIDKRRVEDIAESVFGVKNVQNNLRVDRSADISVDTATKTSNT